MRRRLSSPSKEQPIFFKATCAHCKGSEITFRVLFVNYIQKRWRNEVEPNYENVGLCQGCERISIGMFNGVKNGDRDSPIESGTLYGNVNEFSEDYVWTAFEYLVPNPSSQDIPEHLPDNVSRAFKEAEQALAHGLFSSSAANYRKAVDRAVTDTLKSAGEEVGGRSMLGQKLSLIMKSDLLPKAMTEWIRIVKDDGNFALHDEDKDFESSDQIEPMRQFSHALLTYLYTMPFRVELAGQNNEGE